METKALVDKIVEIGEDFKANDCQILEVAEICGFADYFIVLGGNSNIHNKAIAEGLLLKIKHAGRPAVNVEGLTVGEWVLIDYGDVVTHIMSAEKRAFYDLESLWKHHAESRAESEADEAVSSEQR